MEVTILDWVEDENGRHVVERKEERDYSATADRHAPICVVCGFSGYPKCMEWCPNEERRRKRLADEQLAKEKKAN